MVTERGKEAYQKSKTRKRTHPELTQPEIRQFLELMARSAGSGEFELKLGLGQQDVAWVKGQLKVDSPDDAKRMLNDVFSGDDVEREARLAAEREMHKARREAAQKRLDAEEAQKARQRQEARERVKKLVDPKAVQDENKARQERFDESQKIEIEPEEDAWNVEEGQEEHFKGIVTTRGLRFAADMYGVELRQIRREIQRLFSWIDLDILPR